MLSRNADMTDYFNLEEEKMTSLLILLAQLALKVPHSILNSFASIRKDVTVIIPKEK